MFSFSKGPFLGSMSIFRVVLLLTSTSVVLLKCHVMSIVIILLSKKYGFTFQKMTQSCPLQHRKNEIQTFPTFLFWMSWTFFFRFPGRRWLWCSRTMMLGPAAFGGFSYREVTPLPQMHQEIPKSTSHKPPRKVHDSLLELFIVFSWSFQLQWKSVRIIPNPKPKIKKRKGLQGGLHRCFPPPILWLGIKPFKKKPAKDQRLNITKHRPKTNHFAVSHGVRWSESQGVWWQFRWKMQVFSFVFGLDDWICVFFCCGKKANQFFLQIVPGMSWKISE